MPALRERDPDRLRRGARRRPRARRRAARRPGGPSRPPLRRAGRLLRELLDEAGLADERIYLTNAVKHFKWRPRGTRRIHDKPSWSEIRACGHWLELELVAARPALVVCLGATAAQALLGREARVGALRGSPVELPNGLPALVTIHPSAVLRAGEEREKRRAELLADLQLAKQTLELA